MDYTFITVRGVNRLESRVLEPTVKKPNLDREDRVKTRTTNLSLEDPLKSNYTPLNRTSTADSTIKEPKTDLNFNPLEEPGRYSPLMSSGDDKDKVNSTSIETSNSDTVKTTEVKTTESYHPGFDGTPMFGLDRFRSGLGVVNLELNSLDSTELGVMMELEDGVELVVPKDYTSHNGVTLRKDGGVTLDLSKVRSWRRIFLYSVNSVNGVLKITSPEVDWSKVFSYSENNTVYTLLLSVLVVDGKLVFRNMEVGFDDLKSMAGEFDLPSILWLDSSTPIT